MPHRRLGTHHPAYSRQCKRRDFFMSCANQTGATEKGQILKKVLTEFISQILFRKDRALLKKTRF
jgi:hypothetical protein